MGEVEYLDEIHKFTNKAFMPCGIDGVARLNSNVYHKFRQKQIEESL